MENTPGHCAHSCLSTYITDLGFKLNSLRISTLCLEDRHKDSQILRLARSHLPWERQNNWSKCTSLLSAVWTLGYSEGMVLSSPRGEWALTHLSKRTSMLWKADSFQEIPMPHWRTCSPVCKGSSDGILKHAVSSPYVFMCVWHSPPLCRLYQFPPCFCWIHNRKTCKTHSAVSWALYTAMRSEHVLLSSFF